MHHQVRTLWILSAVLIVASVALLTAAHSRTPVEAAPPAALALTANRTAEGIQLHWDTGVSEIGRADGGTIEVVDGGRIERIPVSAQTVRAGTFAYKPKSDDVVLGVSLHRSGIPLINGVIRTLDRSTPAPAARPAREKRRIESGERSRRSDAPTRRNSRRRR
jgi:hypothetical protein